MNVKICCISSIQEARLAIDCGATAVGLVGHMPSGPGIISNELIRQIVPTIPSPIDSFILTSETTAAGVISHHQQVKTSVIQLVDQVEEGAYETIRLALPGVKLVQVIHVIDEGSIEEANRVAASVDYILLDSGNPNLAVKELGGTGRVHNWDVSREIVSAVDVPVYLAGGLRADNVAEAIERVRPFGVDLCSGVRTGGQLDEQKLKDFFKVVKPRKGV